MAGSNAEIGPIPRNSLASAWSAGPLGACYHPSKNLPKQEQHHTKEVGVAVNATTRNCTCEDKRAMASSVGEVGAGAVLLVAGGAAEAAVAAGVLGAAVARDLTTVHAQRLQPLLQLLMRHDVLLDACRCIFSITHRIMWGRSPTELVQGIPSQYASHPRSETLDESL